jgi:hypothetical protein
MLQRALESEVQEFLDRHSSRVDAKGRRLVVRNGHLPSRQLLTGVGPLELRQPRVRDKSADGSERVTFSSQILPPYLRKTKAIEELIPWLYLKGVSTGDYAEALQSLLGVDAKGLSPTSSSALRTSGARSTRSGAIVISRTRSTSTSGPTAFT